MTHATHDPSPPADTRPAAHYLDALGTIACAALAIVTFGFAAFRFLPAAMPPGASRNPDRTFFEAVNAFTLTGFATTNVSVFPAAGYGLIAVLALAGATVSLVGGGYFLAAALALRMSARRLVGWAIAVLVVPCAVTLGFGAFNAISASTGLGLMSMRSVDLTARLLLAAASAPGVFGVVALYAMTVGFRDRRGYLASSLVLLVVLHAAGAAMLWLASDATISFRSLASASAQSLNVRGLGLPGGGVTASPVAPWATMLLMLACGGPASTAGGLGVLPLVVVGRGCVDAMRGVAVDRMLGVAIAWVVAFFATIALVVLCLAAIEPAVGGERLLLLAVGSVTNVGLSHEPIGITGGGLFVLSAGMLVGRLLPLGMLCWAAILSSATPVAAVAQRREA